MPARRSLALTWHGGEQSPFVASVQAEGLRGNAVCWRQEEVAMRMPLEIPALTAVGAAPLETVYRATRDVRVRTRARMVLRAGSGSPRPPARGSGAGPIRRSGPG